jgi:DNA adenine methylase
VAKPILKWAGGKQAIAPVLIGAFSPCRRYFEPFLGGASVLLRLQPQLQPQHATAGDQNQWLIDTYIAVRQDWQRVAGHLDKLPNTKTDYLRIRAAAPASLEFYQRAAHLIYLNKTCFRGLFRVNQSNQFNVPYGDYDRRYYDPENLCAFASALQGVDLRSGDFELCLDATPGVTSGDFVYFDPPYYKLGGYSDFNRYTAGQFRENDHLRLAAVCRELDARGVHWAVSNSETEFVRRLFAGFQFRRINGRREIAPANRNVDELLITNY